MVCMGSDSTATAPAGQERKAPGRPRSARAEESIIEAVIDLLAEGTPAESISVESVAARAGVGKATIYRRWPNKEALLVDAVARLKGPLPEVTGRSVREDLITLLRPADHGESRYTKVFSCLVAELRRSEDLRRAYQQVVSPRGNMMRAVLQRGIASGELRADLDIDLVMTMLTGPVLAETVLGRRSGIDLAELPQRLVDGIWPAIAARP